MTALDWTGIAVYIAAAALSVWLAVDLYRAWKNGRAQIARDLIPMALCWVIFCVFAVLTIVFIGDMVIRDVTRTVQRVALLTGIFAARHAIPPYSVPKV